MRNCKILVFAPKAVAALFLCLSFLVVVSLQDAGAQNNDVKKWPSLSLKNPVKPRPVQRVILKGPLNGDPVRGKKIAYTRSKGNCLACHVLEPDGVQPGNVGPNLSFQGLMNRPDQYLYQRIWDARFENPETIMPPFGTNEILTEQEIRDVVAYLQTLKKFYQPPPPKKGASN